MHGRTDAEEAAAESEEHVSFHEIHEQIIWSKYGLDTSKDCKVVAKRKVTHGRTDAYAAAESEEHVSFHELHEQIIRSKYGIDTPKDCKLVSKRKV
jgi:hypothetical protein